MNLEIKSTIDNINALVDSQGTVILDNKKIFLNLIKDIIPNMTDEQNLLCFSVENDILDLLSAAVANNINENAFTKDLSLFVNKTLKTNTDDEKEFIFQVFVGVYSHCTGKEVQHKNSFDTQEQVISKNIASAAKFSQIMNGVFKYFPKSFNPIIIPIVLFIAMEIFVIVYLTRTDLVISSINESLGSFIALHIGAIVHSLIGAILCKIAKIKWLSYIPAVISAIVAIYSFFFALGDLEGFFITILGFFFFGAIALGVTALCFMLPTWINKD